MLSQPWIFMAMVSAIFMHTCSTVESYPKNDRILSLPGQTHVTFQQFSGYITIDEKPQKALFYYFVEAEKNPASKPLVLWLNGGPGCSSLAGAFFEHGPFRTNAEGIKRNEYSWNKEANILYLESPAGVGFSYSVNKSFYGSLNDEITAHDNLVFLHGWFAKFPEYKNRDFYITGESYGGHYVPQLAQLIIKTKANINLKGIAIGNPLLDFDTDFNSRVDFYWSHGLVSDSTYKIMNKFCNGSQFMRQLLSGKFSDICGELYVPILIQPVDIDYIIGDSCASNLSMTDIVYQPLRSRYQVLMSQLLQQDSNNGKSDENACAQVVTAKYLNRKDVQKALHTRLVGATNWEICNNFINSRYAIESKEIPTIQVVGSLIRSGIRVVVYSGDLDSNVPFIGTRRLVSQLAKELGLKATVPYTAWLSGKQVGGWTEVYGKQLSYAVIRGASHEAPAIQPERALLLFSSFLQGKQLPILKP